jgi:hypothetical protein
VAGGKDSDDMRTKAHMAGQKKNSGMCKNSLPDGKKRL